MSVPSLAPPHPALSSFCSRSKFMCSHNAKKLFVWETLLYRIPVKKHFLKRCLASVVCGAQYIFLVGLLLLPQKFKGTEQDLV